MDHRLGEVCSVGRSEPLVVRHPELITLTPNPQHRLYKVAALESASREPIEPRAPHDQMVGAVGPHRVFAGELGNAVNVEWRRWTGFFARGPLFGISSENVVSAHVHEGSAGDPAYFGQVSSRARIHAPSRLVLVFAIVHAEEGSRQQYCRRPTACVVKRSRARPGGRSRRAPPGAGLRLDGLATRAPDAGRFRADRWRR